MKRRDFLTGSSTVAGAAVVGAVAASSFPKPALSQGLREMKMVTTWPRIFQDWVRAPSVWRNA